MADALISRVTQEELPALRAFCNAHWEWKHPLINDPTMFDYYYRRGDQINFLAARDPGDGTILGVCGFIAASADPRPDVWVSFVLCKKGAPLGLSLRLLQEVRRITGCATLGCNNIRKKVYGLYEFMGCTPFSLRHYYRVNPEKTNPMLCRVREPGSLPICQSPWTFREIGRKELKEIEIADLCQMRPIKDNGYFAHRYLDNPWLRYRIFLAREGGVARAALVLRVIESEGACVLRVVDYVGEPGQVCFAGEFLDHLLREKGADFCDWYAFGLEDEVMAQGGFCRRTPEDPNIIPVYLTPPLMENVDFYGACDAPQGYVMFRGDGDQDRPNLT